jgi:hypothetical protein
MPYKSTKARVTKTTRLKAIQITRDGATLDLGPGELHEHLEWIAVHGGDEIPGSRSWEVSVERGVSSVVMGKDDLIFRAESFSGNCLAADKDHLLGVGKLQRAPYMSRNRQSF